MYYKEEIQIQNKNKMDMILKSENVPQFIQFYFKDLASGVSRLTYWGTIKKALSWLIDKQYLKSHTISEITPNDLQTICDGHIIEYFEYLMESENIKVSSIQTKKNQLSSFWEYLYLHHYCRDNIIRFIKSKQFVPAKTNQKKVEKLPIMVDIQKMLKNINEQTDEFIKVRNNAIVRVLRGTGLRVSELAGLNLQDIYIDDIYIDERHPAPYIRVISKGNYQFDEDGEDIVYLTPDVVDAIKEWQKYRYKNNISVIDTEALFISKTGNRMTPDVIKNFFHTYSDGKITPHMFRHEYTTRLRQAGGDSTFVKEQGRWKSTAMMDNVYDSAAGRSVQILKSM